MGGLFWGLKVSENRGIWLGAKVKVPGNGGGGLYVGESAEKISRGGAQISPEKFSV